MNVHPSDETELPDDLERTVVSSRRRMPAPDDAEATVVVNRRGGLDESLEETRVVSRHAAHEPVDESTVVVDRSTPGDEEHTVVVDRSTPSDEEHTIVVDRSTAADEHTAVVDRGAETDATIVVPRGDSAREITGTTEDTVVVARPARGGDDTTAPTPGGKPPAPATVRSAAPVLRTRGDRRRGIAPPPVPAGFAPAPARGVGPGATESYPARHVDVARIAPAPLGGAAATRDLTRTPPSVGRRTRRFATVTLAVFVGACAVSVGGLVALLTAVL